MRLNFLSFPFLRPLAANQVFTISAMMTHNLSREIQMLTKPSSSRALPKRPAAWKFEKLDTIRHRIIQKSWKNQSPPRRSHAHDECKSSSQKRSSAFSQRVAKNGLIIEEKNTNFMQC
jgi:hypothetical protein